MLPSPAWKTLPMRRSYFFADRLDVPQDVRQLRPRHDAVLRAVARAPSRPTAPNACLRLFHRTIRSASVFARRTSRALVLLRDGLDALGVLLKPASRPSTSMMSTAPASSGKPKWNAASTACEDQSCRASPGRAGTMPAPMMSLMVLVASSTVSKTPSSVRYASGLRVSRTHTFGDDAERPFAADDDAGQVVAGVVLARPAARARRGHRAARARRRGRG